MKVSRKIKRSVDIFASERFLRAYRKAGVKLQKLAEVKVHHFVNLFRSDPSSVASNYDKRENSRTRYIEIDISRKDRLLAHFSANTIKLLDMGGHDIVPRYSDKKYELDNETLESAPSSFYPDDNLKFFTNNPDPTIAIKYREEVTDEWLYYLDDEQNEVRERIFDSICEDDNFSAMIVGGPGTGKTCILLNLLKDFADSEYRIGIVLSAKLCEYIKQSTGMDVSEFRILPHQISDVDILFCDDPSRSQLELALKLKKQGRIQHIVAGFDPLQLDKLFTDQEFNTFKYRRFEVLPLRNCYRQKENLGLNTRTIVEKIAASSPFLTEDKIERFQRRHEKVTAISNDLDFLNPNGYVRFYEESTIADIESEIARISSAKNAMWKHAPGLLILLDQCELTPEAESLFKKFERLNYCETLSIDEVNEIKGLEYQHVFIFIKKGLFDEIQMGFKGSGQRVYDERRLLRIPFSRAKDSLVTFAIDDG